MTGDGSIRSFPRRDQEQFQSHGMVEAFMTQQQLRGTGPEGRQHQRNSPAPTVRRSHPSSTEHSLPLRTNATPAPSVRHDDPNTTRTRIRLSLVWDTTVINMWIDLNAPAEDIFRVFQEHAEKRRSIAERSLMSICLKNDKNMPDHESYDLSLDEEDLDADWETTIEWLEAHKREKSPHIYGVIQIQDG
ncbi:hypothetical protein PTT_13169 [Pyrenophora teres f. teres 0-1]|uniref:Uncharacterized protein n=2 Tax=Pyrenophora teres f. teres TaxID=97479 RepID=E3RVH8_PYRTT|nr:hypothetical protein PTT_13169 [Pyrenophora teres f. teres 0-1]CAE7179590.1 hypothetical protein PTTW11_06581 [Pyrenophora teres f. teres]